MITDLSLSIQEAIEFRDQPLALEVLTYIQKNGSSNVDEVTINKLSYVRLSSLSLFKASVLLKESILVAYQIPEYVLSGRLIQFVEQIDLIPDMIEFVERLENTLDSNEEILGSQSIGKWIQDYENYPQNNRDAFSQTRYISGAAASKSLSKEEKDVLTDLLKISNYIYYILTYWQLLDQLPQEEINKQIDPSKDWISLLSGIVKGTISESVVPELEPKTDNAPISSPPVHKKITQDLEYIAPAEPDTQHMPPPKNPVHLTDSSDLDDMIKNVPRQKMGVVRDPTNIKIADEKQRLEQEQNIQAKRIQQKLSELRKRNTKL